MNYLVYQAYNNEDNLNECLYSLYSLVNSNDCKNIEVIIYTNKESYLKKYAPSSLNIRYRIVSQEEISDWKGTIDFVHRFKIKMLQDLLSHLNIPSNILYIDTDTTIRTPLKKVFSDIAQGKIFMHQNEGKIHKKTKHKIFKKIIKYQNSKQSYSNLIPENQIMWNAGAIGLQSTDKGLLDLVLEKTDLLYSEFPIHIIEQLCFSIVLSQAKGRTLNDLENEIFHYWDFKEFRQTLKCFFTINTTEKDIISEVSKINPETLIIPKRTYQNLPFFKKQFRKMLGKWELEEYNK